jgi:hypothetical protein
MKYSCNVDNCTNIRVRDEVCIKHGAKRKRTRCYIENCQKYAVKGGICIKHGAKRKRTRCYIENCQKYAVRGGICVGHGAKQTRQTCKIEKCKKYVQKDKDGFCIKHFNEQFECKLCYGPIYRYGMCVDHVNRCSDCNEPIEGNVKKCIKDYINWEKYFIQ